MHPVDARWQLVELFSGVGNVTRAFRDAGYTACNFDKLSGGEMDFSTPSGFAFGAQYIFGTLGERKVIFHIPSKACHLDVLRCRTDTVSILFEKIRKRYAIAPPSKRFITSSLCLQELEH